MSLKDVIWVGRLRSDEDVLVYDGSWQPTMPKKVRLYSTRADGWRFFLPDIVRSKLERVDSAAIRREALRAYAAFEAVERAREAEESAKARLSREERRRRYEEWRATESERARERARSLNAEHLARLGIDDTEYRIRAAHLSPRTPRCWACKHELDSRQDLEHVRCSWLVCVCGACGCK